MKKRAHWKPKSICGKRTWKRDSNSGHLPLGAGAGGPGAARAQGTRAPLARAVQSGLRHRRVIPSLAI